MSDINTPRDSTLKTTEQTPRNIADVLADELSGIAQAIADGGSTDYDDLTHRPEINSVILTGDKSADDLSLAMQEDLTSIKAIGTTNATGATISKGTYFYLNGTLCQAKADIATNAAFTLNTNYEVVTAGGLNSLNSALTNRAIIKTYTFTCIPTTSSPNGVYNYWWSDYFNISDTFGVNEGTAVLLSAANLNDFGRIPQVELLQNPTSLLRVAVRSINNTDSIRVVIGIIC